MKSSNLVNRIASAWLGVRSKIADTSSPDVTNKVVDCTVALWIAEMRMTDAWYSAKITGDVAIIEPLMEDAHELEDYVVQQVRPLRTQDFGSLHTRKSMKLLALLKTIPAASLRDRLFTSLAALSVAAVSLIDAAESVSSSDEQTLFLNLETRIQRLADRIEMQTRDLMEPFSRHFIFNQINKFRDTLSL